MNTGAISLPALWGAYWWPAEGITGGRETGVLCPPYWLLSEWLSDGLAIPVGPPNGVSFWRNLAPKNLDWWNLVRGLIGLKDRSKRCLYWLDCFFLALESFTNFHLMASLVVQWWWKLRHVADGHLCCTTVTTVFISDRLTLTSLSLALKSWSAMSMIALASSVKCAFFIV